MSSVRTTVRGSVAWTSAICSSIAALIAKLPPVPVRKKGEGYVLGRQRRSVGEHHAVTQRKRPGEAVIRDRPALRQLGVVVPGEVDVDERVIDQFHQVEGLGQPGIAGIARIGRAGHADAQDDWRSSYLGRGRLLTRDGCGGGGGRRGPAGCSQEAEDDERGDEFEPKICLSWRFSSQSVSGRAEGSAHERKGPQGKAGNGNASHGVTHA